MMRMVVKVKLLIQMMIETMMCLSVSHYCPAVVPPPLPPTLLHCMHTDCDDDDDEFGFRQAPLRVVVGINPNGQDPK